MKQTAVEWQFEQFFNSFEKFNNGECTFNDYLKRNLEIRKQAKEMEKEQMKDLFNAGVRYGSGSVMANQWGEDTEEYNFEQYYNETYKTE